MEDSGLDDYDPSIVYIYPRPDMTAGQIEWLPCLPFRQARHVKLMMILTTPEFFNLASLDVYGF